MSTFWSWTAGILIAASILGLMAAGRAERSAYWQARGAVVHHVVVQSETTDLLLRRAPGQ